MFVYIGTGTGYYTAIMACLAGPSGKVTGIELDASLAARAKAGATQPVVSWLEGTLDFADDDKSGVHD
jgi:protein-L-isoaspartate(D-aspartate) O-methyltransferase